MTITTITTHVEPGEPGALEAAVAGPFALAEAHGAHLIALVFSAETSLVGAAMVGDDLSAAEDAAAEHLRAAASRRGITCDVRSRSSFAYGIGDVLADHLRVSDLGMLTLRGAPSLARRLLIGAALFDSGRPLLLAPGPMTPATPERIVVAWDATPAAVRAVHGALPLLKAAKETLVVTVTDDKEMRAGQSGIEMAHLLARHGVRATFAAQARTARGVFETLTARTAETDGSLLVMGAVRHSPLHNMVFGSATDAILRAGPGVPVLLSA